MNFNKKYIQNFGFLVLIAAIALSACKDSSVSGIDEEEINQVNKSASKAVFNQSTVSNNIIIDDFNSGAVTISAAGSNVFNYHENGDIQGGAREITVRDAFSGQYGGRMNATVDENSGTLQFYVTGRVAAELSVMYGTAIGTIYRSWSPSPNQGAGSEMNLSLTPSDSILVEVTSAEVRPEGYLPWIQIILRSGNGAYNVANFDVEEGINFIALSDFPNMTEDAAADIDGIVFGGGLNTYGQFAIKNAEPVGPVSNTYVSSSSIQTWDAIFPAIEDRSWSSSVCYQDNTFGLTANWVNPHNAFEVTQDNGQPHPWDNATFDASWINSYNSMNSQGPGGHNWSKYETQVAGDGDFVIQLLADNCSWVYLSDENGNNPQLIGYQGATSSPGEYGVSLDGNHTLTFVIFDGGGLAGGKFRLETTEDFGGPTPPPIDTNTAPIAEAGADQTITATSQTTSVTLDGSGSSDADGDALTYSWTLDDNEVSTSASFSTNLADGNYIFTLTVSDGEESDSDAVSVTVVNTVPVSNAGTDQTLEATGPTTAVTLIGSATDADGDALTYSWSNGSTSASTTINLGVGTHTFTFTVSDGQGASDSDEVSITIVDTTSPVITFNQEVNSLWPPNHKMVLVASGISSSDIVDGIVSVAVRVSSNEASNGKGDGNTDSDYEIRTNFDGSVDVYVRAERSGNGKSGRTYTITMTTNDAAGNSSLDRFEVSVAKSQGLTK